MRDLLSHSLGGKEKNGEGERIPLHDFSLRSTSIFLLPDNTFYQKTGRSRYGEMPALADEGYPHFTGIFAVRSGPREGGIVRQPTKQFSIPASPFLDLRSKSWIITPYFASRIPLGSRSTVTPLPLHFVLHYNSPSTILPILHPFPASARALRRARQIEGPRYI